MKEMQPHYSDKGGHKERSAFHKELRRYQKDSTLLPMKIDMWQARRTMRRIPQSGK